LSATTRTERSAPFRAVRAEPGHGLVLEVPSKAEPFDTPPSGIAMRFPRINRLRWTKPPSEADDWRRWEAPATSVVDARSPPPCGRG